MTEAAKRVWEQGFAPLLSTESLEALRVALDEDDERILQNGTTDPPPLRSKLGARCTHGCPVAYCGMADGLQTVGEVEEFFTAVCLGVDNALGEPAAARYFLNWVDETPRVEMREELAALVRRTLAERLATEEAAA